MYANAQNADCTATTIRASGAHFMLASVQTMPQAWADNRCSSHHAENAIMRVDRQFLVLGVTLAAAMSVLIAGCGNRQDELPASSAKTTVGTQIDDTVVTTRVKSALLADADIKSFDLKVETRKGTVQLSGFVDNQAQIDRAIAATRGVQGVSSVENGIGLKAGSATVGNAVDDGIVTAKVKSALLAEPSVKSFDIAVVTRKGEVQLSGFVDSQAQIDQAMDIARKVDGVTSVGNEMSIKK
ncbi:MAG: BON domain-containing protein [Pseudomonadota bacterium]